MSTTLGIPLVSPAHKIPNSLKSAYHSGAQWIGERGKPAATVKKIGQSSEQMIAAKSFWNSVKSLICSGVPTGDYR